jgi:tetratricopeptide (TPR) repeat protein
MLRQKWFQVILGMLSTTALIILVYFLPPIHNRLSWRVDLAASYLRGAINPIDTIPTAAVNQLTVVTSTPDPALLFTSTPTPLVSPTAIPPTHTPTKLPSSASLQPPEFEQQTMNNCGPAALSLYLRYYGWKGHQKSVAEVLKPKPEDRNVNVEELVYFVRNNAGWLNIEYRVGGDINVLKTLLANGIPVMVEESFHMDKKYWPTDDLWAGHYLVLTGYNDATNTFVGQDTYYGPDMVVSYSELEINWQSFNHVFIMIYPPEKEDVVKDILGDDWDVDKNRQRALDDTAKAARREPSNTYHWFNLGSNLVYFERYGEAATAYDKARELGFPQRMLRYQFGPFIAYFHSLRTDDLEAIAKYAIGITPNSEEARLWMGWSHFRNGDEASALSEFRKALNLNETYIDAQYALNYLLNN